MGRLPLLEPLCRVGARIALLLRPRRPAHVDEQGLKAGGEGSRRDVEKTCATRPAEELSTSRREKVAADRRHIDGQLADGLAGVDEIQRRVLAADRADLGY